MKKTMYVLCALVALVACSKEAPVVEKPTQKENQEIKVNFNISRGNIADATKATVKTGWATNDVVFVFFANVTSPSASKYLKLKYNGSTWDATLNGLTASDFDNEGKITAIYLPYGSDYEVAYADNAFSVKSASGANYSGHFYVSEKADYSFSETTLTGTISLSAATPITDDDVLVHFDVTGYTGNHEYEMYQDYMKPFSLTSIALDGTVTKNVGDMGDAITGYVDTDPNNDGATTDAIVSFSGVLDKSAKKKKDWQFSINDKTEQTDGESIYNLLYTIDAGNRTISSNMYIGLGSLSSWITRPYVDLGVEVDGKRVMWATRNLGAEDALWIGLPRFGNYYGYSGATTGYPLIYVEDLDCSQYDPTAELYEGYNDYTVDPAVFNDPGTIEVDANNNLKSSNDDAHTQLKGLWRTPTKADFDALVSLIDNNDVDYTYGDQKGYAYDGVASFETNDAQRHIELPLNGYIMNDGMEDGMALEGYSWGEYWTSTLYPNTTNKFYRFVVSSFGCETIYDSSNNQSARTIRPVFSIK